MSKILKGLNEVNPHNYDSDWDYQNAVASSGRSRSSYRSQEDDTFDDDVAYSKKMYQLSQKQKRDADHDRLATGTNEEQLDELSNEKLGQYKTAAALDAGKADSEGDYKRADKRFSGIVKATKKQFANDTKTVKEDINVVYKKAKSLITQLDENTQQRVINALTKNVDDEEQKTFKSTYPRVNNPKILGTQNRAKSAYYPPSKPNVKKLDKPLPENLGNELKSKSLEALQQVKQQLEQQRMADLEQWEKDFKQNTVSKFTAREPNLNQRATSTSMIAMPGEKHSELKARLSQLDKAIEKQGILDNLVQKLDKKGLLTPNIEAGVDTSMLARDGARDNYVELNRKLDKALEYVKNRLLTNKAAYAKPKGVDEGWSQKYKSSINCSHPKGFSQKAHCAGKKKHNESIDNVMEMTCPDCGMCETHGDNSKNKLDELSCWPGHHRVAGTKAGAPGSCEKNKTNEEQMDEIDRRGFLKGMGAAAVAGAAGGVATKANAQQVSQWVKYATDLATKSMGRIHQDTGYDLRNWLVVNVSNWVTDYCTKTNSYNAKEVIDYCNQQGLEASGLDKQHALVTAFLTNMKNRYQDFLSAYRAGINESFQKFNAAVQSQEKEKNVMGNLSREEFDVLLDALIIYAICKDRQLDNSELFRAVAASIKRFIDANNAKDYVNSIYPKARQSVEVLKNNPDIYQKESSQFFKNAGNTIAKLDNISSNKKPEFESVNQGVAEEQLNELDFFAPVTTFIKMTDGSYIQADWRKSQGNPGLSDSASFVNFKPVNPNVAKQLGLDSYQRNNSISNHRDGTIVPGGPIQGSGPLANRGYEVVDYNKPETMKKLPPEIKSELIKWVQKQNVVEESCPHCNGPMFSEMIMNEKKDACYYKVKSRYKVWPSAYASGALVKCRKSGADSWGNGGKKNESSILEGINRADESLHDWFNKEKWVRMDTKGKIKGPCAREPGEGKPKCLPQSKAHSLGKKGRASAAQRKRREDPNPERSGKAINVNTKKK